MIVLVSIEESSQVMAKPPTENKQVKISYWTTEHHHVKKRNRGTNQDKMFDAHICVNTTMCKFVCNCVRFNSRNDRLVEKRRRPSDGRLNITWPWNSAILLTHEYYTNFFNVSALFLLLYEYIPRWLSTQTQISQLLIELCLNYFYVRKESG